MDTDELVAFLDRYLEVPAFPDYPTAMNGLQVEGPDTVRRVATAVDASEPAIEEAVRRGADLLLVHHGMFWDGFRPITGRRHRKLAHLMEAPTALYAAHLPLDAHPEVGNCAVLARELGLEPGERFGTYEGVPIGFRCVVEGGREDLRDRLAATVDGPVRLIPGGPERVRSAALVTGGASSFLEDAARAGVDALVTGEGPHHTYVDALELGMNVYYAGHYATETWGVRAMARVLEERFGLPWDFIHLPSGL